MTGFVAALIACFIPLEALANLISLGTLMVFTFVDAGVILLRLENTEKKSIEGTEESEIQKNKRQSRVIVLLLIYTISILGISFVLSNHPSSLSTFPVLSLSSIALICGILICNTPNSWSRKRPTDGSTILLSQSQDVDNSFQCPCFPIIPLGGVALNTILMGGLPLSSWLLCIAWITLGLGLYFSYGIHNSKIGENGSPHSDSEKLLKKYNGYMSTGQ